MTEPSPVDKPLQDGAAAPVLTVVIASVCDEARSELLQRACDSVRAMARGHTHSILVVANGKRVSPKVLTWLQSQPDVQVVRTRTGSYPLSRRIGAELAPGEFIAFVDDDDELLPDTLGPKLAVFRERPEVDVLVTDGLRITETAVTPIFPPAPQRRADLIETMMHAGWGAGALMLRARSVDLSAFDAEFRQMEWTLTTLMLARHHQVAFLDQPTYRYYETTPDSLSKKAEHSLAAPEVWRRLSRAYAGTPQFRVVRRRYGAACHNVSSILAKRGQLRRAWRAHLRSLLCPGGWIYLSATARLTLTTLRKCFA